MTPTALFWGILLGAIGGGYILFGMKQKRIVALACGLVLSCLPYFIASNWLVLLASAVLMWLPFRVRV
jgi:hypothetical protein